MVLAGGKPVRNDRLCGVDLPVGAVHPVDVFDAVHGSGECQPDPPAAGFVGPGQRRCPAC